MLAQVRSSNGGGGATECSDVPTSFGAAEPPITVWQPKPTRRIDWALYDDCTTCHVAAGAACLDQRVSNRHTTGRPEARLPHRGRPRVYKPTPPPDRTAAIAALLATAAAAQAAGIDLETREALHALGITDVEISAIERQGRR